jgi:hypothetical protein
MQVDMEKKRKEEEERKEIIMVMMKGMVTVTIYQALKYQYYRFFQALFLLYVYCLQINVAIT